MHKLRFYCLPLFLVFFTLTMSAQGMTDEQVMKFVIKEHASGTSQAQIVSKLVARGVNINQIRRVRKKFEKQIQDKSLGSVADKSVDDSEEQGRQLRVRL